MARFKVGLGVDTVFDSFFIHGDDVRLPLTVSAWNAKADVGNDAGVVTGNSFSYRFY